MPVSRWARASGETLRYPEMRLAVANSLVDQRLLLLEANKGRLGVNNALLVEIISAMPSLQVDGSFPKAPTKPHYLGYVARAVRGASAPGHMIMQQLVGAIGDTGIVSSVSARDDAAYPVRGASGRRNPHHTGAVPARSSLRRMQRRSSRRRKPEAIRDAGTGSCRIRGALARRPAVAGRRQRC